MVIAALRVWVTLQFITPMNLPPRLIVVVLVAAVAFLTGQASSRPAVPDVIRAHAFELVGQNGRVAGELRTDAAGNALFVLRDATAGVAIQATAAAPGGAIRLYPPGSKGNVSLELLTTADGGSWVMTGRHGSPVMRASVSERDFGGELNIFDAAGNPSHTLTRSTSGIGQYAGLRSGAQFWVSPEK